MTTLFEAPLAPLLAHLFKQASQSSQAMHARYSDMPPEEYARRITSKTDYLEFYGELKDEPLAVSAKTGRLLYILVRASRAHHIVEYGTSFGISTLHMAAALRDNGGGRIITSEFEPSKVARARANLEAAELLDLVEIREGDALETLARGLPQSVDFLLLDGAKSLYLEILDLVEDRLRPGALIVADNTDWCPEYLERVRSVAQGYASVGFAHDVELSFRLG